MRWFGLRVITWALAAAVIVAAVAAYAVFAAGSHGTSPGQERGHHFSSARPAGEDLAAEHGVPAYSKLIVLQARQTTSVELEITNVGRGPERSTFARVPGGRFVARQDVPARGVVSVQSICSSGLTCTSRSSARQVIAGPGRSATWRWEVAARSPGEARIVLVATSYGRRSKVVQHQTDVMRVKIQATPLYFLQSDLDAHGAAVFLILGGVLAATAGVGAVLALLRKARRGRGTTPPPAGTPVALTEPLRLPVGFIGGHSGAVPAARPALGWSALLRLALIDVAVGELVMVAVLAFTTKSAAFAAVAGAAVAGALPLYLLPLIIAYVRAAPDRASVAVINVLLGWTYLGWVAALALAVRDRRPGGTVESGLETSPPGYLARQHPGGESGASHARRAAVS